MKISYLLDIGDQPIIGVFKWESIEKMVFFPKKMWSIPETCSINAKGIIFFEDNRRKRGFFRMVRSFLYPPTILNVIIPQLF